MQADEKDRKIEPKKIPLSPDVLPFWVMIFDCEECMIFSNSRVLKCGGFESGVKEQTDR
jgi:hypothetical protein